MEVGIQKQAGDWLPLLSELPETATIAIYNGKPVSRQLFLSHVEQLSKALPQHKYLVNLCENRYHFLVVFAASMLSGQVNLLPASRADQEISRLEDQYPGSCLVEDELVESICKLGEVDEITRPKSEYLVPADNTVAIVFTSGSTGVPKANPKTWRQLSESAWRVKQRFAFNQQQQHNLVATVPPQHMFGFETTIVYPLASGVAIHAGRPFYPLDVQSALQDVPGPSVLVTTPVHLKACASLVENWPSIDFVVAATAMMPPQVARNAEQVLGTQVNEIYGCSEAGAIATRRTTAGDSWSLLQDYQLQQADRSVLLSAPGYPDQIMLPDNLELLDASSFRLAGRNSDLVKMGGKRGSLADLTIKLKALPGVEDAIVFMPEEKQHQRSRLAALVVAPSRDEHDLRQELSHFVDSVFLPRPMIKVEALPYNELGKLPRQQLQALLEQYLQKNAG